MILVTGCSDRGSSGELRPTVTVLETPTFPNSQNPGGCEASEALRERWGGAYWCYRVEAVWFNLAHHSDPWCVVLTSEIGGFSDILFDPDTGLYGDVSLPAGPLTVGQPSLEGGVLVGFL